MSHGWGNQLLRSTSQKLQVPLNQMLLDSTVKAKIVLFYWESKKRIRTRDIISILYIWNIRFFSKFHLICMGKGIYCISIIIPEYFKHPVRWGSAIILTSQEWKATKHPEILRPLKWYLNKMYVLLSKSEILKTYTLAQPQQEKCGAFLIPWIYLDLPPLVTKKSFCLRRDTDLHHFSLWKRLLIS